MWHPGLSEEIEGMFDGLLVFDEREAARHGLSILEIESLIPWGRMTEEAKKAARRRYATSPRGKEAHREAQRRYKTKKAAAQ